MHPHPSPPDVFNGNCLFITFCGCSTSSLSAISPFATSPAIPIRQLLYPRHVPVLCLRCVGVDVPNSLFTPIIQLLKNGRISNHKSELTPNSSFLYAHVDECQRLLPFKPARPPEAASCPGTPVNEPPHVTSPNFLFQSTQTVGCVYAQQELTTEECAHLHKLLDHTCLAKASKNDLPTNLSHLWGTSDSGDHLHILSKTNAYLIAFWVGSYQLEMQPVECAIPL